MYQAILQNSKEYYLTYKSDDNLNEFESISTLYDQKYPDVYNSAFTFWK